MTDPKSIAAVVGTALLVGAGIYLLQQRELSGLRAENQGLEAQRAQLDAEVEAARRAVREAQEQLAQLQRDNADLLRLRNEVGQLRRERDAARERRSQLADSAAGNAQAAMNPGRYIAKEQLAFVGYATPEAALESVTWAMMNGTYEQTVAGLGPELQQHELQDGKGREQFEAGRKRMAPLFKGIQIVARKTLSEDKVELKVKMDADLAPDAKAPLPEFMIQPMVKVGNEWKLGGSTRGYDVKWEQDGQIQQMRP